MSDGHSNTKKLLIGIAFLVVVTLIGLHLGYGPRWYQGYAPIQPIPFSHRIHAGKYHLPCLYCHGSAEYSSFSAVPGLETCMNCHKSVKTDSPWIKMIKKHYDKNIPIKWVKVHVLPDFVSFNHSPHIRAGLQCQTCHGPIQTMDVVYQYAPLNMGWCVDCHRNTNHLTKERISLLTKKIKMQGGPQPKWVQWIGGWPQIHNADTSCSTCHY